MLGKDCSYSAPPNDLAASDFLKSFFEKTKSVRQSTSSASGPLYCAGGCSSSLLEFRPVDANYIIRLIRASPNKNCSLDPVPTWIIKQYSNELAPFVAFLANSSLRQGFFPRLRKMPSSRQSSRNQTWIHTTLPTIVRSPICRICLSCWSDVSATR